MMASAQSWAMVWPASPVGGLNEASTTAALWIPIAAAIVAALAAALVVAWRWHDVRRDGPAVRALAKAAGLSSVQRRFLQRRAQAAGFSSAGPLLLSRGCFDHAATRCNDSRQLARVLFGIRRRLFPDALADAISDDPRT